MQRLLGWNLLSTTLWYFYPPPPPNLFLKNEPKSFIQWGLYGPQVIPKSSGEDSNIWSRRQMNPDLLPYHSLYFHSNREIDKKKPWNTLVRVTRTCMESWTRDFWNKLGFKLHLTYWKILKKNVFTFSVCLFKRCFTYVGEFSQYINCDSNFIVIYILITSLTESIADPRWLVVNNNNRTRFNNGLHSLSGV
jgi:hypothetical protein